MVKQSSLSCTSATIAAVTPALARWIVDAGRCRGMLKRPPTSVSDVVLSVPLTSSASHTSTFARAFATPPRLPMSISALKLPQVVANRGAAGFGNPWPYHALATCSTFDEDKRSRLPVTFSLLILTSESVAIFGAVYRAVLMPPRGIGEPSVVPVWVWVYIVRE